MLYSQVQEYYIPSDMTLNQTEIKRLIGKEAAQLVKTGMVVGLGSGTTATFFIESLVKRCQEEGVKIQVVSSSTKSLSLAQAGGIPTLDPKEVTKVDVVIDGADEVNPQGQMIKGGGGALTREKIIASMGKQMIVIVDESKVVDHLGAFGLPIEILEFGAASTIVKLKSLGYRGKIRTSREGSHYRTDNKNLIFDIDHPKQFLDPKKDHQQILTIPGVLETGLFFDLPVKVLVGYADGTVKFREE